MSGTNCKSFSVADLPFYVPAESEAVVRVMAATFVIVAPLLYVVPQKDSFLCWWGRRIESLVTHFGQNNRKFPGELDVLDVVSRSGWAECWSGSCSSLRLDEGLTV